MKKRTRAGVRAAVVTLVAGVLGVLIPASAQAQAQPPVQSEALEPLEPTGLNPAVRAFDVLIVRPLSAAALPVGVALFVPAALLTAPNGMDSVRSALDIFVTGPARYVFKRPLGEF